MSSIRSRMPTVAAIFDEVKQQFPSVKLLYGRENGQEIDARTPVSPESVFQIPANYAPCRAVQTKDKR